MKTEFLILISFSAIISILLCQTASPANEESDYIIIFNEKPGSSEKALIHSIGGTIKHSYNYIPAVSARLPEQAVAGLCKKSEIAFIEDDILLSITKSEYDNSWGVSHIGSKIVHKQGIYGSGVKIAVIDTGIDYAHKDLDDNYKGGYDFVYTDPDPLDDSSNSHGTHVAGIIAAEMNGFGVVGVAPEVDLYAVKVLDGSGHGLASWVIAGIEWAINNDMDIVTMSMGTSAQNPDLQSLQMICDMAYDSGVLLVASAGNTNGGIVTYPARFDSVIAVTATDQNDMQTSFSSTGQEIELAAPGIDIISSIAGNNYDYLSGTSQAAPHVAGLAALIISGNLSDVNNDGNIDNKDIRLQLQMTVKDIGEPGRDDIFGYGLIDAPSAIPDIPEEPDKDKPDKDKPDKDKPDKDKPDKDKPDKDK